MFCIEVNLDQQGRSLLKFVSKILTNQSYNQIEKLFRLKKIKVNGKAGKKTQLVNEKDKICVFIPQEQLTTKQKTITKNTKPNFKLIYEDENILVVSKKHNTVMHSHNLSLDSMVATYLKVDNNSLFLPTHIGRLDKLTSGIVLYAKNYQSAQELYKKQHFFVKQYTFKSDINLENQKEINIWIAKNDAKQKMEVVKQNSEKSTLATTLLFNENKNKIAQLKTGKKHQIRLTLAHLGFPIHGDSKYGGKPATRLFLHSFFLKLINLENKLSYLNNKEFIDKPTWWS